VGKNQQATVKMC